MSINSFERTAYAATKFGCYTNNKRGIALDQKILISTAVGAFIGSFLTLIATIVSHWLQVKKQKENEKSLLHGFLQGIHDEIETLWDLYIEGIGHRIEILDDGEGLNYYYPVTQEYFTFYTSNAFLVGKIKEHDLRKDIVSTYAKAKGLIDCYRMNNDILSKSEHAIWIFQASRLFPDEDSMKAYESALIEYATTLKERHNDVKQHVQSLLRNLRKQGVLNKSV